jgi:hypothetical protein
LIYCSSCGKRTEADMKFCPGCGQKLESNLFRLDDLSNPADDKGPRAGIIAVQKRSGGADIPADEPVLYSDESGLCVTRSLLIVPGKSANDNPTTYVLSDFHGVKTETDITGRIIGAVGVVIGIAVILARNQIRIAAAAAIGTVLIVLGTLMVIFIHPTHHLMIVGTSGELDVLQMSRKPDFDKVVTALGRVVGKIG